MILLGLTKMTFDDVAKEGMRGVGKELKWSQSGKKKNKQEGSKN